MRNDAITLEEIEKLNPSHIVLSPGPGKPCESGICEDVIRQFKGKIPIFGVCLGHQAICEVFGATVTYAKKLMHGKKSKVSVDMGCPIYYGLPFFVIEVARYHSLAADESTIPEELIVTGKTEADEVMSVMHRDFPIYGVQFHPESILTPNGKQIMENFLKISV